MPWIKGQSGNPGGRPREDMRVSALIKKIGPCAIKRLERISKGLPVRDGDPAPSPGDVRRANEYLADRAYGKPAAPDSGGAFEGATIIVDTGIRRVKLNPPTIDATPVEQDQPVVNETDRPD
jgi:hypothetical protein